MPETVIYLMGAGASIRRVPVVKGLAKELSDFEYVIRQYSKRPPTKGSDILTEPMVSSQERSKLIETFADEIKQVVVATSTHATLDTYAKKLSLRGRAAERDLRLLKIVFLIFLTFVQSRSRIYTREVNLRGAPDPREIVEVPDPVVDTRYDSFLASVLRPGSGPLRRDVPSIPDNIKFMTWNYDYQFEKAYYGFSDNLQATIEIVYDRERYLKINGTSLISANISDKQEGQALTEILGKNNFGSEDCFRLWHAMNQRNFVLPRFAWEQETLSQLPSVLPSYSGATILVIIGYSFPYFNKEVDRMLLDALPNLHTIYLQVHPNDYNGVYARLKSLVPDFEGYDNRTIQQVHDLDTFYIPDELTP